MQGDFEDLNMNVPRVEKDKHLSAAQTKRRVHQRVVWQIIREKCVHGLPQTDK